MIFLKAWQGRNTPSVKFLEHSNHLCHSRAWLPREESRIPSRADVFARKRVSCGGRVGIERAFKTAATSGQAPRAEAETARERGLWWERESAPEDREP